MSGEFDVSSDVESGEASKKVGKQPISLEDIPRDLMVSVSSFLKEVDANALSGVSKIIYNKLLQNTAASTANRRARAIDYRLFSQGRLPLQDPITLPSLTLVNKVKPQFLPVMIVHNQNDEDSSFSKKKSLSLELLLNSKKAMFNTVNVLMRNLPTMVREIITIEAINHLSDSGDIKYADAKLYLDIIIADRKTKLSLSALKKLILGIERLSDVPEKHRPLLCQAIASYIVVFNSSLENNMQCLSNDIDVITLFKKYNLGIEEITVNDLECLMVRILEHKSDAMADKLITELMDVDANVRSNAIKALENLSTPISKHKSDAMADSLMLALQSSNVNVRVRALLGLGAIAPHVFENKADAIADILIPELMCVDDNFRSYAANALSQILPYASDSKAEVCADVLISLFANSNADDRAYVFCVVGKIAGRVLEGKADAIADSLLTALEDFNANDRINLFIAVEMIATYVSANKANILLDWLFNVLKAANTNDRVNAASALGIIMVRVLDDKVEALTDKLITVLEDSCAMVRVNVIYVLCAIVTRVSDDNVDVIANKLITMLEDSDAYVRASAVDALGVILTRVSDYKAGVMMGKLMMALEDSDAKVQSNAVAVLVKIAAHVFSEDKVDAIADKLIKALESLNENARANAANLLAEIAMRLSENKAKLLIEKINKLDESIKEIIIVTLCRYFSNPKTFVDTLSHNNSPNFIQRCLLKGENLFYILHYLLNDKTVVTEDVTWLKLEAYGTFISKVITGYQQARAHMPGNNKRQKDASYELNNILHDSSATSQQKMEAVVKYIWQEKNQSVLFGTAQHSLVYTVATDVVQEMVKPSSSAT